MDTARKKQQEKQKALKLNRLALIDALEVNTSYDIRSANNGQAVSSLILPHNISVAQPFSSVAPASEKFSFSKRSIMNSMNVIERQKIKAMKVVEKMQQQFQKQLQRDAEKTIELVQREKK